MMTLAIFSFKKTQTKPTIFRSPVLLAVILSQPLKETRLLRRGYAGDKDAMSGAAQECRSSLKK